MNKKPVDVIGNLATAALRFGGKWEEIHDAVAELIAAAGRVQKGAVLPVGDVRYHLDFERLGAALARVKGEA